MNHETLFKRASLVPSIAHETLNPGYLTINLENIEENLEERDKMMKIS